MPWPQIEKAARSAEGTPPEIVNRLLGELNDDANRSEVFVNPAAWRTVEAVGRVGGDGRRLDDSVRGAALQRLYTTPPNPRRGWRRLIGPSARS